jgi:hypothetical protein
MNYNLVVKTSILDTRTHYTGETNGVGLPPVGACTFLTHIENSNYIDIKKLPKELDAEHLTIILTFENSARFISSTIEIVKRRVQLKKKTKLIFDRSYENGVRLKDILKIRKIYIKLGLSKDDILFFLNSSCDWVNSTNNYNVFKVDLFAVISYLKVVEEDYPTSRLLFKRRPNKVNLLVGNISKHPRLAVLEEFHDEELLQESLVGLLTTEKEITRLLPKGKDVKHFRNSLISKIGSLDGLRPYRIGKSLSSSGWSGSTYIYDNSNLSYVVETWPHTPVFHTEKIYRPIINRHPFVLMASEGSLASLKNKNILTLSDILDESYDTIESVPDRIKESVLQTKKFLEKSASNADKIQEIVNHNYEEFIKYADNEYQRSMEYLKTFLDRN